MTLKEQDLSGFGIEIQTWETKPDQGRSFGVRHAIRSFIFQEGNVGHAQMRATFPDTPEVRQLLQSVEGYIPFETTTVKRAKGNGFEEAPAIVVTWSIWPSKEQSAVPVPEKNILGQLDYNVSGHALLAQGSSSVLEHKDAYLPTSPNRKYIPKGSSPKTEVKKKIGPFQWKVERRVGPFQVVHHVPSGLENYPDLSDIVKKETHNPTMQASLLKIAASSVRSEINDKTWEIARKEKHLKEQHEQNASRIEAIDEVIKLKLAVQDHVMFMLDQDLVCQTVDALRIEKARLEQANVAIDKEHTALLQSNEIPNLEAKAKLAADMAAHIENTNTATYGVLPDHALPLGYGDHLDADKLLAAIVQNSRTVSRYRLRRRNCSSTIVDLIMPALSSHYQRRFHRWLGSTATTTPQGLLHAMIKLQTKVLEEATAMDVSEAAPTQLNSKKRARDDENEAPASTQAPVKTPRLRS